MGLKRPSEVSLVNELFMAVAEEGDDKKKQQYFKCVKTTTAIATTTMSFSKWVQHNHLYVILASA